MSAYYIDTSALVYRYVNGVPSPTIDGIVNNTSNDVFIATLTLLEWSSALSKMVRTGVLTGSDYRLNEQILMKDVAEDRLIPISVKRDIEFARLLIHFIGVLQKRKLTTGDALQLVTAKEISFRKKAPVKFMTCDRNLADVITDFNLFHPYLVAQYLPV